MKKQYSIHSRIIIINVIITVLTIIAVSLFIITYIQDYYAQFYEREKNIVSDSINTILVRELDSAVLYFRNIRNEYRLQNMNFEEFETYVDNINTIEHTLIDNLFIWNSHTQELSNTNYNYLYKDLTSLSKESYDDFKIISLPEINSSTKLFAIPLETNSATTSFLCAEISLTKIGILLENINYDEHISFVGTDENSQFIFSSLRLNLAKYNELFEQISHFFKSEQNTGVIETLNETQFNVNKYTVNAFGQIWTLVSIIENTQDFSLLNSSLAIYLFVFCITFTLLLILGTTFVLRSVKIAISQLQKHINMLKNKKVANQITASPPREFGELFSTYNDMSAKFDKIVDEKLEVEKSKQKYEYQLLLAQVNPHFLYNSLYSIDALVDLKRYSDIKVLNISLISLLSYSIGKLGTIVKINEELNIAQKYIDMQQIRYDNKFSLNINVSDEIRELRTIRMVLLPLVENSVYHGFSASKQTKSTIEISAELLNDDVVLFVKDNGVGIEKERLNEINAQKNISGKKKSNYVSIGISNINQRIKSEYGEKYGITVYSSKSDGTLAEIIIPKIEE